MTEEYFEKHFGPFDGVNVVDVDALYEDLGEEVPPYTDEELEELFQISQGV